VGCEEPTGLFFDEFMEGVLKMKKRLSPVAVILLIVIAVAAFVVAALVQNALPESVSKYKDLIFWGIIVLSGGIGSFVIGKVFGGKKR